MTRRVLLVSFLALAACKSSGEQKADATGGSGGARSVSEERVLRAAMLSVPKAGVQPDSLPDANSPGARILVHYCTQCHALPSPTAHGAQDWPFVARQMWVFIDEMQGELGVQSPSTAERAQLLAYLQANALDVASSLPAGPGKGVFVATCARCHVLPDPRRHSPVDWPNVVMRMERNMERFRVSGVGNWMAGQIIGYLRVASARK